MSQYVQQLQQTSNPGNPDIPPILPVITPKGESAISKRYNLNNNPWGPSAQGNPASGSNPYGSLILMTPIPFFFSFLASAPSSGGNPYTSPPPSGGSSPFGAFSH